MSIPDKRLSRDNASRDRDSLPNPTNIPSLKEKSHKRSQLRGKLLPGKKSADRVERADKDKGDKASAEKPEKLHTESDRGTHSPRKDLTARTAVSGTY